MEQIDIYSYLYPEIAITKPIRLIELFAGYGSQAMALKRIGAKFEHYRVIEFDKFAIESYNTVHDTAFPVLDITKVHAEDLGIERTDEFTYLLTYSFPCTDLSLTGKQAGMKKGSGTRSGLLWEVERLFKEIVVAKKELPQILLMENVPQVHSKKNIDDFNKWIDFLESIGFRNYWKDLNSKDYGIPQSRNRTFMVSILGNYNYKFPKKIKLKKKTKDLLEKTVDEKCYRNNVEDTKLIKRLIENGQIDESTTVEAVTTDGKVRKIANTLLAGYYKTNMSEFNSVNAVIEKRDEFKIRKLTPRECGRLMGVSDEDITKMERVNSKSQLYKQLGNSIVVNVMCELFKQLNINQEE